MMPVHDAPVHPSTVNTGQPYGCHSQPKGKGYFVRTRVYSRDGTYVLVDERVPHRMSTLCRYDGALKDPRCFGCTTPSDDDYLRSYGI